jgi:hypothetical protein
LQNSWSEMLILDQIHQRMHNHLPDETTLHNGQKFELLSLALLGVPSMSDTFQELTAKLTALKFDSADYVCLKFVLLLNPGEKKANFFQRPIHKLSFLGLFAYAMIFFFFLIIGFATWETFNIKKVPNFCLKG